MGRRNTINVQQRPYIPNIPYVGWRQRCVRVALLFSRVRCLMPCLFVNVRRVYGGHHGNVRNVSKNSGQYSFAFGMRVLRKLAKGRRYHITLWCWQTDGVFIASMLPTAVLYCFFGTPRHKSVPRTGNELPARGLYLRLPEYSTVCRFTAFST